VTKDINRKAPCARIGAFLFIGSFGLYLLTLAPCVAFWDSGELIAGAFGLGVPHQPGYPLYCMTAKAFSLIPLGNVAYRANLLSASSFSLATFILYHILLEMTSELRPWVKAATSASLSLLAGTLSITWPQAEAAEVYGLNAVFVTLLIYLIVIARRGRLSFSRYMPLSGFVFGLGVVDHQSIVLYAPTLLLTWLATPGPAMRERVGPMLTALFFMALGLSVYIYLPVRAWAGVAPNIGHPETLSGFLWVQKWGEYIRQAPGALESLRHVMGGVPGLDKRLLIMGAISGVIAWRVARRDWRMYAPLLVYLTVYTLGVSALTLGNERDIRFGLEEKFFAPTAIMVAVFAGGGAGMLAYGRLKTLASAVVAMALMAFIPYQIIHNWRACDRSDNYIAFDYAQNALKSAGQGGVLYTWGDNGAFPLWYTHMVERYRDDVTVIHAPLMTYAWYLADAQESLGKRVDFMPPYFLGENVNRVNMAVSPIMSVAYDYSARKFLDLEDAGLTQRGVVYFEGKVPPGDPGPTLVFRGVDDPAVFKGPIEENILAIYEYQKRSATTR